MTRYALSKGMFVNRVGHLLLRNEKDNIVKGTWWTHEGKNTQKMRTHKQTHNERGRKRHLDWSLQVRRKGISLLHNTDWEIFIVVGKLSSTVRDLNYRNKTIHWRQDHFHELWTENTFTYVDIITSRKYLTSLEKMNHAIWTILFGLKNGLTRECKVGCVQCTWDYVYLLFPWVQL